VIAVKSTEEGLVELAVEIAEEAGRLLLDRFGTKATNVSTKDTPTDPVSDADRDSQKLIVDRIGATRPDDGIISEEGDHRRTDSGVTWVVDPLDGTVNFLYGIPEWAVSIALYDADGLVAGVVCNPCAEETFAGSRGAGATLNGRRISVSEKSEMAVALVGTGFSYDAQTRARQARRLVGLLPQVRDIRRCGSAALDLAAVACGRLDGFFEAPMKPWDRAAGEILIREAGGVVEPLAPPFGDDKGVIASGPALHAALLKAVRSEKE
jgi:myo-inositol-1(or 4)-monophosphatase